jgi:Cu+-exporting ATPase
MSLKDPVCGMSVSEESEHHYRYDDVDYIFCCSGCLGKFKQDPEKYLHPDEDAASSCCSHETEITGPVVYICPVCPEVE